MKCPVSTYRIQLSPEFTFQDLRKILDYLEQLGISTIYAAPFFQARKGSTHGYDITNPLKLNREIGTLDEFRELREVLKKKGMTWLQDIVPNHMAFDATNPWLRDILEYGADSPFYRHFDVDWKKKKIMAPFLGAPLDDVLQEKELNLKLEKTGFTLNYFDNSYPLALHSYAEILPQKENWKIRFANFSEHREGEELKKQFLKKVQESSDLRDHVQKKLKVVNASEEHLREILELQHFEPVYWKTTEEKINYRRFFTINDLLCLRMEDPAVFQAYHVFINQLVDEGLIDGLRIDHIDGLCDPLQYLEKLRSLVGSDFYVIIEKILEWDEKIPAHWPVQGTSGYGFLAVVNQLMTDSNSEGVFNEQYQQINPRNSEYEDLAYEQKLFILKERMGGEFKNIWDFALKKNLLEEDLTSKNSKEALGAFLAAFPVYRIYPEEFPLKNKQREIIQQAYDKALDHFPGLNSELDNWKEIFLGEAGKRKENMFLFLQRCQQFTGPLAAKGVEDTSFYLFNRLISHNEVGDSPENFGLSEKGFHDKMLQRIKDFPLSVNATATHDTKRGEDARMRINVLSEMPNEWFEKVQEWSETGKKFRNDNIPDSNEEYFIFQMLIGSFPFGLEPENEFLTRSEAYLEKVLREAKVHSSWAEPDEEYETSVFTYLRDMLNEEKFLSSFLPFQKRITTLGVVKSLSQCLLKVTAPGIPDIYQGTELWDLSYVDPDNRRPVDYSLRKKFLSHLHTLTEGNVRKELGELKKDFPSGKIKMFCLRKALEQRRKFPEVFEKGDYIPIVVREPFKDRVIAYGRKEGENYFITVIPVLVTTLFTENLQPVKDIEIQSVLEFPKAFPEKWQNMYTGAVLNKENNWTFKELFEDFPVALLKNI